MPNDLSDLLLWRRRRGAPSWLLRDPDTGGLPALDIDYSGGRAFKAGSVVDLAGLHTVSRASGGYAENLDGSLTWFGNNVMRRTDRGVLVEGSRTNLLLRSQEFENAAWTKRGTASIAGDTAQAPDGTMSADRVTVDSGTNDVFQSVVLTAGAAAAGSIYVKKITASGLLKVFNPADAAAGEWTVNLALLSVNWERIHAGHPAVTVVVPFVGSGGGGCGLHFRANASGQMQFYAWGAQLEAAAFPSSYIPTGASSATRASDRVTLNPNFIGGEGTFVAETFGSAGNDASNGRIIGLGTTGQVAAINRTNSANVVQAWNGAQVVSATMGAGSWKGVVRAAIAFSPAGRAICGNAGGVATDAYALGDKTSLAVGSQSTGAFSFYGYIRRLTYFDRRISNAGLQALTA